MAVWERLPLCFELLSPIHIGFLPKSRGIVVSPTRPYVPGKNLWGAVTAALTPRLYDAPAPSHFVAIGQHVRECLSFSYFYLSDGEQLFAPSYESSSLRWGGLSDSEFRSVVLDSRLSTEIGETGAAEDGGLHEIEFIRHRIGSPITGIRGVFLCGVAWHKKDGKIDGKTLSVENGRLRLLDEKSSLDILEALIVGGERNYGFGRIQASELPSSLKRRLEEMWPSDPSTPIPLNGPLLGHAKYQHDVLFKGQIENLASREYSEHTRQTYERPGSKISMHGHFFAPGTVLCNTGFQTTFDSIGQVLLTRA